MKTVEELKQHPDIKDYRKQYHDLRREGTSTTEIKQFHSAHTILRHLDKKRNNLLGSFISELNPIKEENTLDSAQRRSLARILIREKSDNEIVSLVIKQRTEAALEFQCAVELILKQLSEFASTCERPQAPRRKISS